jgi:hypothetical protein
VPLVAFRKVVGFWMRPQLNSGTLGGPQNSLQRTGYRKRFGESTMSTDKVELSRRTQIALEAIKRSLGTEAGQDSVTLFANHHIEELDASYWQTHLNSKKPTAAQVIGILILRSHWGPGEDGIDTLDFTLPGDVTNYVVSVRFDEDGAISEISMES